MNATNSTFPLDLLSEGNNRTLISPTIVGRMEQLIINAFSNNGVTISEVSCVVGPTVVRFELIPDGSFKLKQIRSCEDKLNEALSEYGPIRLIAPVPGKGTIAVEVPRADRQIVWLREVLESKGVHDSQAHLPVALGIDSENNTIVADLAKMPHLLVSGATGQGKSVLLNNIILSLLYRLSPADLKLVLIDPKQLEFGHYNLIKNQYLLRTSDDAPEDITEIDKVLEMLNSINCEIQHRFDIIYAAQCRNIQEYNQKIADGRHTSNKLPYIVVVIDEFADFINVCGRNFVRPLLQIAAKSRAVGIHLIIATQRPSPDVITGLIKANFPARIALKVDSDKDSGIILDTTGAQQLLGMGDMLFSDCCNSIKRLQSCFVDTSEIEFICRWIAKQCHTDTSYLLPSVSYSNTHCKSTSKDQDPLFVETAQLVMESNKSPIDYKRLIDLLSDN